VPAQRLAEGKTLEQKLDFGHGTLLRSPSGPLSPSTAAGPAAYNQAAPTGRPA
jgi:hypothetical protein